MAETRRINVWINNELQGATPKQLAGEYRRLKNEINNLTPGTEKYIRKTREFQRVKGRLQEHNQQLHNTNSWFQRLRKQIGPLGQAISGAFAVGGITQFIRKFTTLNAKMSDVTADVRRTTGMTTDEVRALREELMKLDTRTSLEGLMQIAEGAGRLGVAKQDIEEFVEVADRAFVALGKELKGDATDIATQLGKIAGVFDLDEQFGQAEAINKVGSSINALGQTSKAQAQNIVDITSRLAGLGKTADIAPERIMGLAATLDDLGLRSEAASTAIGKILQMIGQDIPKFAELAGVSVEEMSERVQDDPIEALAFLLEKTQSTKGGLEGLAEQLDDLGINSQRASQVIGALGQNTDRLRELVEVSNEEFKEGTSLINEFESQNTTLNAEIEKLGKNIREWFINSQLADTLKSWIGWFNELIEVPLSEELRDEQVQLNVLKNRITDANIESEERVKLIKQLKTEYPDYLSNIDEEKISNKELSERIAEVNDQYVRRIVIQSQEEKIMEQSRKVAELRNQQLEQQAELETRFAEMNQEFNLGLDLTNKTFEERAEVMREALQAQTESIETAKSGTTTTNKEGRELQRLVKELSRREQITKSLKQEQKELQDVQEVSNEIIDKMREGLENVNSAKEQDTEETEENTEAARKNAKAQGAVREELQRIKREIDDGTEQLEMEIAPTLDEEEVQEFRQKMDEIVKRKREAEIQLDIMTAENPDERLEAKKEQLEMEMKRELENEELTEEEKAVIRERYRQKEINLEQETNERIRRNTINTFREIGEQISQLGSFQQQLHRNRMIQIRNEKQEELDALKARQEQGEITEEQYHQKREDLREKFDQKEQKLKQKQAKREKKQAIFQSIVDTAAAVVEALPNIPLSVAVGAMGAAQTAAIAAEPIPQFASGGQTKVKGDQDGNTYSAKRVGSFASGGIAPKASLGLIGERGPELVIPNWLYESPRMADTMGMLENMIGAKQFQSGGATSQPTVSRPSGTSQERREQDERMKRIEETQRQNAEAINNLNETLKRGIGAQIIWKERDTLNTRDEIERVNNVDEEGSV